MPLVFDEVGSDLMLLVPVLVHGVLLVFDGVGSGIARSMYIGSTGGSSEECSLVLFPQVLCLKERNLCLLLNYYKQINSMCSQSKEQQLTIH